MADKLSGEARIDALLLELKAKHGFVFSEAVMADAEKDEQAEQEPIFAVGEKVKFTDAENPDDVKTVSGYEEKNGQLFYTLEGDKGGLYLQQSLVSVEHPESFTELHPDTPPAPENE